MGGVFCEKCDKDGGICTECSDGSRMNDFGQCKPCREDLQHCRACDIKTNTCEKCYESIAYKDDKGKCTDCKEPWVKSDDGSGRCVCADHVNVRAGFKCQKCEDLIPGCQECE